MAIDERVYLGAYWRDRRITAKEFIKLCYGFLARLREFSSAFDHRCVVIGEPPEVEIVLVPKDYPSFERLMIRALPYPGDAYTNPDPSNQELTLESTYLTGFSVVFSDAGQKGVAPTKLAVFVCAGSHGGKFAPPNSVLIKIPPEYREFRDNTRRANELLELVVTTWNPTFATLTSSELERVLNPHRGVLPSPGRLTYFADEKVGEAANSAAKVEYAPNGGVFLTIDAPYPWAASVDRFKPCYARLSDAGLLKWPA